MRQLTIIHNARTPERLCACTTLMAKPFRGHTKEHAHTRHTHTNVNTLANKSVRTCPFYHGH
jgi:hypothetical protein